MKNKILIAVLIGAIVLGVGAYLLCRGKTNKETNNEIKKDSKTLVVYYSAQGHTDKVAKEIASNLNADIFELIPEEEYTSDDLNYNNKTSRGSKEHNDERLRDIKLKTAKVENWEDYETILIGYPIWWGTAAWPVNNFVLENDFTGKTIIPFCTSASSSLGNSGKLLADMAKTGTWLDGHRFSSSANPETIKEWTDSIVK